MNISKFKLKEINEEIKKQQEVSNKLIIDKRKDDELSLAHDSLKWVDDYIRLDYVSEMSKIESNLWNTISEEEDKIENLKQEQRTSNLTKKLTPPKH